jgi:subtilisin family serine protease
MPSERKKRYLIGHRYGPRFDANSSRNLDAFVSSRSEVNIVRRTAVGRCVIEMDETHMQELADKNRDIVIEADEELQLFAMPGLPKIVPTEGVHSLPVVVTDSTDSKPIPNVTIYGIGRGVAYKAVTDERGTATLQTYDRSLAQLIASPRDTYWSKVLYDTSMSPDQALNMELKPLLVTGAYDWGHRLMGFRHTVQYWTGKGVKIGIIDSGITDKHADLAPTGGYNALEGQNPAAWNVDEKGHGTHVAGVTAAKNNRIGVLGGAPNAEVYSLKIFPGGRLSDLVEAVEWCIHNRLDVICMSLGGHNPSRVVAGVLRDAYDRGITCVAAAGNESTHVAFPAAYPTVIAVGAIGRFGTFPEDSAHALTRSRFTDQRGGLFAANFMNHGPEIDVCAPGVAILSTVPTGYAAWDGTSIACPLVSALVTLILEANPALRTGDANQSYSVRSLLFRATVNLGMSPYLQGRGLPLAPRVLPAAQPLSTFSPSRTV